MTAPAHATNCRNISYGLTRVVTFGHRGQAKQMGGASARPVTPTRLDCPQAGKTRRDEQKAFVDRSPAGRRAACLPSFVAIGPQGRREDRRDRPTAEDAARP